VTTAKILGLGLLAAAVALAGCDTKKPADTPKGGAKAGEDGDEHDHGPGPHGGTIIEFGKYHGEFVVDHKKQEATVYILDGKAEKAVPIPTDTLLLSIKSPQFQVELKAAPLEGEPKGRSSRFVGKHEKLGVEQEFAGTVSGEIDGKPHLGDFEEKPPEKKPAADKKP
jgi:hypothetical protein